MKLEDRMRLSISNRKGHVVLRSDVASLGSSSQVSVALRRLQEKGFLVRTAKGVYAKTAKNLDIGVVSPMPEPDALSRTSMMPRRPSRERRKPYGGNHRTQAGMGLRIPEMNLRQFILSLAKRFKVTYVRTYSDDWARNVTRLAGDDVQTDEIEQLVIAMNKAHKVSDIDMVQMLARYMREKPRA